MARRRPRPRPHTEGPYTVVQGQPQPAPWRVLAGGRLLAEVRSGSSHADAERIAAALTAIQHLPTEAVQGGAVDRLWVALGLLLDVVLGTGPVMAPEEAARHREAVIRTARRALAAVGGWSHLTQEGHADEP
ncbi:MAG: hypothetical protein U0797_26230 [Gemmataceae bacterium]